MEILLNEENLTIITLVLQIMGLLALIVVGAFLVSLTIVSLMVSKQTKKLRVQLVQQLEKMTLEFGKRFDNIEKRLDEITI